MAITVSGQKPCILNPVYASPLTGIYDPVEQLQKSFAKPLLQPYGNKPVTITDEHGQPLVDQDGNPFDSTALTTLALQCMQENVDIAAENMLKDLLSQTMVYYDKNNLSLASAAFVIQAATKERLPQPTPTVIYTAGSDVIPSAKKLLSDPTKEDEFFASLAYTYKPNTLGFWFQDETAFEDFKQAFAVDSQNAITAGIVDTDDQALIADFAKVTLKGLTEGLVLRKDPTDSLHEGSFPRVLINSLMRYRQKQAASGEINMGVMPFRLEELYAPKTIVLVNIEAHARNTSRKVDNEWRLINAMLSTKVRVLSNRKISKLTALPRAQAKANALAATAKADSDTKSAKVKLRKIAPTSIDITKGIIRALKRMKEVNRSHNIYKKSRKSFLRASRRHPDDPNYAGRTVSTRYFPDVHIFLDTSGSISESNYRDAIFTLIKLAKKMNVDLYFNSFSHNLSQPVLLKTRGKSVNAIWNEFRKIPKVSGGTDYKQIWQFINEHQSRKERFSIIITDFEWYAPTEDCIHPKNLYYAPISNSNWDRLKCNAKMFIRSMNHIDATVASKLIGVTT